MSFNYCYAFKNKKRLVLADEQVDFHKRKIAASTSPVEQARRHLHIVVIVHDVIALAYFVMVLGLQDEKQWMSVTLLAGVTQITAGVGGLLTMRMWIYT